MKDFSHSSCCEVKWTLPCSDPLKMVKRDIAMSSDDTILAAYNIEDGNGNWRYTQCIECRDYRQHLC